MARRLKITASALNVRLHPHEPGTYEGWIEAIYQQKIIAPIHGDRHGMISMLDRRFLKEGILDGIITTFVKIEDDGDWFNAEKLEKATDEQKSEIQIPHNLFPNSSSFYFRMNADKHRIYIQNYSDGKYFTPNSTYRFFSSLALNLQILEEFGKASISIVQSNSSINEMFLIESIKKVTITLKRPNTDIFDDNFERNIESHLNETGAQELTVSYRAQEGRSIVRDDDMMKLTAAASTNGTVSVTGRDDKGAVTLRSDQFPKQYHDNYDPDIQSEHSAFLQMIPGRNDRL